MKTRTALCLTILVMLLCAMNMAMVWQLTHVKEGRTVEMTATAAWVDSENAIIYVERDGALYLPDVLKDTKYYTFGDNKTEQAARAYWAKIKGEENV